ncbi:MAG: site-specific DNA-methyltransferase [Anaerolineae bacterium]|nr:site-specific DNA-methyltransferase [Anaerolineales bacterium]MCQ3976624.1 site-specific DNA-methyltransferase [Anaerolineae bacterium]
MNNLFNELKDLLAQDDRFMVDDDILKNQVVEFALKLDKPLLKLLLSHPRLKEYFFVDVDGVLVFDQEMFIRFVNNKAFLPDSYTSFKNKIGLAVGDDYLQERREVVLAWPYKDCVLQGGQDQEDAKRDEIFWNEILAPDEIDRLFDPKVLTGFKRYNIEGEHPVTEIAPTDNLIIKGNNLLALHSLKRRFAGKVKLIYIDPPYNNGEDSFGYNDRFNHSTWLTFIKNRLEAARELLQDNGVIFIHIGDRELHYLKVLTDEVFGRDNFIATIPRKTRSGKSDVPYKLSQDFDWMIAYTKRASRTTELFQRTVDRKYYKSDDFPDDEWRLTDLTTQRTIYERPNSDFTLINPRNGEEFPVNPNRCWGITKDSVDEYLSRKKIVFPGDYDFLNIKQPAMRVFKSEEIKKRGEDFDKSYVSSDFLNQAMDDFLKNTTNKKGTDEIVALFGEKVFAYPKNELLLQRIIEYTTVENDIVLDFNLGSGTTAAVAHKMGRQYIGIEQMDYVETITIERLKKVVGRRVKAEGKLFEEIEFDRGGISQDVGWQGGGSFVYCELMQWNQRYIDQIETAATQKELQTIWQEMQAKAFLSYRLDVAQFNQHAGDFADLNLDDQKKFLLETLDKNQLYVNLSEMDDVTYGVSEVDKTLNRQFYELE